MMDNILLPYGIDPERFQEHISNELSRNLPKKLIYRLSSLLAIDYATRLNAERVLTAHLEECTTRIKKYLGRKILIEDDFSIAMSLFVVAITPEIKNARDKEAEELAKGEDALQDAAINAIIAANFSEISSGEVEALKGILKELIKTMSLKEIMTLLDQEPDVFKALVKKAIKQNMEKDVMLEFVREHIEKIIVKQVKAEASKDLVKNITEKLSFSIGLAAVASIGLVISGFALPALIVPGIIIAPKIISIASDVVGSKFADKLFSKSVVSELKATIDEVKSKVKIQNKAIQQIIDKSKSLDIKLELGIEKEKTKTRERSR